MEQFMELLPILIPIIIIELGMRVFAIIDIIKLEQKGLKTRWDKPTLWIILVGIVNLWWIAYFIFGKEE